MATVALLALIAAMLSDFSSTSSIGGGNRERMGADIGPDLFDQIQVVTGGDPGPWTRELRALRSALAGPLGPSLDAAWPRDGMPRQGAHTRFDALVPWLLMQYRAGSGPEPTFARVDMPLPLSEVLDWTQATHPDLTQWTWRNAEREADAWHRSLMARQGYRAPVPPDIVLTTWADGATLVRLTTPESFDAEGISMGHCLRRTLHYWDDVTRGEMMIASYRDPQGVPQVTFELDLRSRPPHATQVQGPGNGSIPDPLARARLGWWLVQVLGLNVIETKRLEETLYHPVRTDQPVGGLDPFWAARLDLIPGAETEIEAEKAAHALDEALRLEEGLKDRMLRNASYVVEGKLFPGTSVAAAHGLLRIYFRRLEALLGVQIAYTIDQTSPTDHGILTLPDGKTWSLAWDYAPNLKQVGWYLEPTDHSVQRIVSWYVASVLSLGGLLAPPPPAATAPTPGGLLQLLQALRPALAAAAQAVLDEWQPDEEGFDEELGAGGACDGITQAMTEVVATHLGGVGIEEAGHEGDDHAWFVVYTDAEAVSVDIPSGCYEEGGGYCWTKRPDVHLTADDVVLDPMPRTWIETEGGGSVLSPLGIVGGAIATAKETLERGASGATVLLSAEVVLLPHEAFVKATK